MRYVRGLVLLAMLSGHTDGGQRHSDNLSGHACPSRKRTTFSRNIGEAEAPSNVEEDRMHAAYGGTILVGSKFRFVGEDVTTARRLGALDSKTLLT